MSRPACLGGRERPLPGRWPAGRAYGSRAHRRDVRVAREELEGGVLRSTSVLSVA